MAEGPNGVPGRWGTRGQAAVELALIAPLLITLLLGVAELGNALRTDLALVDAAREGARLAARGNIFQPSDLVLVVTAHARGLDLAHAGAIVVTTVQAGPSGFTAYTSQTLLGSATSRFDAAGLAALYNQVTAADPAFLRDEQFVIVEVFYNDPLITGLFGLTLPMYAYTIMPIAAPS
jgi:hypothetical protein